MRKTYCIDRVQMLFVKRYCGYCGEKLSLKQSREIIDTETRDILDTAAGSVFDEKLTEIYYDFFCSKCNSFTSWNDQQKIHLFQKSVKRRVLQKQEIDSLRIPYRSEKLIVYRNPNE